MDGRTFLHSKASTRPIQALAFTPSTKDINQSADSLRSLPLKHASEIGLLELATEANFHKWLFLLRQGFSLLLCGFGSKRALLHKFGTEAFTDGGVLLVNGLAAHLTPRSLLAQVAAMALGPAAPQHTRGSDSKALLSKIQAALAGRWLYIIVHNVEGPGLRSPDAQALLSELAACPGIGLLASMDHVNTPLLWDKAAAARFNWLFLDVTTYTPYASETMHIPSLLAGRQEAQRLEGAAVVLRTLVPHARAVFRILAVAQAQDAQEPGMAFHQLYQHCRERFLVSNETTLRAHLTEFRDHSLLQTRRGQDGTDLLYIPIEPDALEQVLQDMDTLAG